jgi:hypothetical protein
MSMKIRLFIFLLFLSGLCVGQSDSTVRPKQQPVSYQAALSKADLAAGSKDYLTAKRFYKQALKARPGDNYAKAQIDVCDRKISNDSFMTSDWDCPCKQGKVGKQFNQQAPSLADPSYVLDISSPDSVITCAIPGVVIGVSQDTMHHILLVVVKHGKYFTSYSNLDHVSVKMGDDLKEGDKIGVPMKANGQYMLEFSIFHGKEKEDPTQYVRCH